MTRKRLKRLMMACGLPRREVEQLLPYLMQAAGTHEEALGLMMLCNLPRRWINAHSGQLVLRINGRILAMTITPPDIRAVSELPAEVTCYLPRVLALDASLIEDDVDRVRIQANRAAARWLMQDIPQIGGGAHA